MNPWRKTGIRLLKGAERAQAAGDDKAAIQLAMAAAECFIIARNLEAVAIRALAQQDGQ